jgi:ribonucleoside-diphosphate reductase alpha chain
MPPWRPCPGRSRRKLSDERHSLTHKFDIAGHEGYITVGLFDDGQPGEIFLVMAKEGSTISGFADAFAQAISYALQYGVPLQVLVDKFSHARFEPSGMTKNPEVRFAKSNRRLHLPVDVDQVHVQAGTVRRRREHGRAGRRAHAV